MISKFIFNAVKTLDPEGTTSISVTDDDTDKILFLSNPKNITVKQIIDKIPEVGQKMPHKNTPETGKKNMMPLISLKCNTMMRLMVLRHGKMQLQQLKLSGQKITADQYRG